MKMLQLAADGDSIVFGSSISLIKVVHRAGTAEYYMAGQPTTSLYDNGAVFAGHQPMDLGVNSDSGSDCNKSTGGWTLLANGNGVLPVTVGNVISENVENEIRMALKAGLESMGVDTKAMIKQARGDGYPNPYKQQKQFHFNHSPPKTVAENNMVNNTHSFKHRGNYNNNKCLNNLNLNKKLDVISENEKMQMTDEEDLNKSSLSTHNKSVSSMMALMATAMAEKEKEDNAQSILEEHCSRIWDSSAGQTPSRSPGRHSPERVGDRSYTARSRLAGPSPNVSGLLSLSSHKPYHKRTHKAEKAQQQLDTSSSHLASMLSFDSGINDDKSSAANVVGGTGSGIAPSSSAAAGSHASTTSLRHAADLESRLAGASGGSSTTSSKHVHHHHHHHHISTKEAKMAALNAKQLMELEAQSRSFNHYRSSQGAGSGVSSADISLRDSFSRSYDETGSRGRSRDAKRSSNVKKVSDTSSNLDSGVSVRYEPTGNPANEKVLAWMMENEKMHSSTAQYSTDSSEKSSSYKRSSHSHKSSSGGSRQGTSKKPVQYNASRSGSLDRSLHPMMSSEYLNLQGHQVLPAQPMVQDPSMPLLNPPNPMDQLEEVKRRLEDECKAKMRPSRSFNTSLAKDKRSMPPPHGFPVMSRSTSSGVKGIAPPQALDLSADSETSFSIKKTPRRAPTSAPTTPAGGEVTVVGYQLPGDDIPYRTTIPGRAVTLGQFKQSITKRGNFRYFFKAPSDEFGSGVIYEEVCEDTSILPLWEGKVFGKLEKVD